VLLWGWVRRLFGSPREEVKRRVKRGRHGTLLLLYVRKIRML